MGVFEISLNQCSLFHRYSLYLVSVVATHGWEYTVDQVGYWLFFFVAPLFYSHELEHLLCLVACLFDSIFCVVFVGEVGLASSIELIFASLLTDLGFLGLCVIFFFLLSFVDHIDHLKCRLFFPEAIKVYITYIDKRTIRIIAMNRCCI